MTRFLVLAAGATLVAGGALAHHGWGSYDAAKPFTIRGQVETHAGDAHRCSDRP